MSAEPLPAAAIERLSGLDAQISIQPWESDLLGKPVYKIFFSDPHDTGPQAGRLLGEAMQALSEGKSAMVCARVPAGDTALSMALEDAGFRIVECYVELCHALDALPQGRPDSSIDDAGLDDIPQLREIATRSFRFSRYHGDPLIAEEAAALTRAEWIENAVRGRAERVIAYRAGNGPVGFVTAMQKKNQGKCYGVLDLIGVHPSWQQRGVGSVLTRAFLHHCHTKGYECARVGTQAHNIPSLRLYQSCGFHFSRAFLSFHLHLGKA